MAVILAALLGNFRGWGLKWPLVFSRVLLFSVGGCFGGFCFVFGMVVFPRAGVVVVLSACFGVAVGGPRGLWGPLFFFF